ncbi:hypothetical protein [Mycobacteroides abscessus]|uniref:Uncharacterized protein n=1 Tax=Mycobacteroides abscessus TaxID=36809 RepID=A0A0U0ZN19_9MYCO|nr:hypothetical protein [Mycobacteroides abscessus]WJJ55972.1 hypothetical protein PROPHIT491_36 [Mycobacterium phage prophiT49-1]SKS06639.1 Uncharacterised protein [Mycobacteroides abscessus subsp. abscessus]MBL3735313.1 hypothetical protein [Mycobacteroides abscessus subsp. massiliense]MBL3743215.1 hypothetical protein [Mycobacteroides abscessus subsp. massiliense]MBL3761343.1 hypothetical protein [Mycobacteroides abscessus subsp. massiliense]
MTTNTTAAPTTGYLTSFAATYQIEGVTEAQAARIAAAVQTALQAALTNLANEEATTAATANARVLAVRVERHGPLVEEYEAR